MNTLDQRLARLAPTTPADSARHDAALTTLLAEVRHGTSGADPTRAILTDHDHDHDHDGMLDDGLTIDVVVPGRRRPRRTAFAVAAAGIVAVAGAAAFLLLPPLGPIGPAARQAAVTAAVEQCRDAFRDVPPQVEDQLEPVVSEIRDGRVFVFLATTTWPAAATFCDPELGDDTEHGGIGWSTIPHNPPADDAISFVGGGSATSTAVWGYAGPDVDTVSVTTNDGTVTDASVTDGYWVAWWASDGLWTRFTWTADGRTHTATDDELTDGDGHVPGD